MNRKNRKNGELTDRVSEFAVFLLVATSQSNSHSDRQMDREVKDTFDLMAP